MRRGPTGARRSRARSPPATTTTRSRTSRSAPTATLYDKALADARARLVEYHEGVRYQYCQDVISPDIFDPFVPRARVPLPLPPQSLSVPAHVLRSPAGRSACIPGEYVQPRIGVPFHVHWIDYDPTEPAAAWAPRRTEWQPIPRRPQARHARCPVGSSCRSTSSKRARRQAKVDAFRRDRAVLTQALNEATADPEPSSATRPRSNPSDSGRSNPVRAEARGSQTKVSALADRPAWLDVVEARRQRARLHDVARRLHLSARLHQLPRAERRRQRAAGRSAGRGLRGRGAARQLPRRPVRSFRLSRSPTCSPRSTSPLRRPDTASTLWGSRYMAWMALGGTTQANSPGHHPARRGDADPGRFCGRISTRSRARTMRPATC